MSEPKKDPQGKNILRWFVAFFVFCIPVWWFTSRVHRASLPRLQVRDFQLDYNFSRIATLKKVETLLAENKIHEATDFLKRLRIEHQRSSDEPWYSWDVENTFHENIEPYFTKLGIFSRDPQDKITLMEIERFVRASEIEYASQLLNKLINKSNVWTISISVLIVRHNRDAPSNPPWRAQTLSNILQKKYNNNQDLNYYRYKIDINEIVDPNLLKEINHRYESEKNY